MPVKKVMAIVQQQSVAKHRMIMGIYGQLHPCQYNDLKPWLNDLSTEIPAMPEGEGLTLIDNDQVLLKNWTFLRKDNRAQTRILKKVCVMHRLVPMMQFCKETRSFHKGNVKCHNFKFMNPFTFIM